MIERSERNLWLSLLKPGMTVADIGSNMGYFAMLAARAVGQSGKTIAFEPAPSNLVYLRRNLSLNSELAVIVEELAISSEEGEATFHTGWHEGNGSLLEDARGTTGETFTVRTCRLDDYRKTNGIDRIDLLKLDIEGAEVLAFEGMAEGLKDGRYGHIMLEWHGRDHGGFAPERPKNAVKLLAESGYGFYHITKRSGLQPITADDIAGERIHVYCKPAS
jgi:FkbM family methyltransferase